MESGPSGAVKVRNGVPATSTVCDPGSSSGSRLDVLETTFSPARIVAQIHLLAVVWELTSSEMRP